MTVQTLKKQMVPILKRQGVTKAAIFGSFATGEAKRGSDVDILVQFTNDPSLMELAGLKVALEEKVGKKIDVVTYSSIHPRLRKSILEEQKIIYEKRS